MDTIQQLVSALAEKHGFVFRRGEALWISGSGKHAPLILAVADDGNRYVVARTYFYKEKPITGFRVYFDQSWRPFAAVGDDGSVVKDVQKAAEVLCHLIQSVYLGSDESWIRKGEYPA